MNQRQIASALGVSRGKAITDSSSLTHIVQQVQPDDIYNLAAQSHVAVSFEEPEHTANSEALRRCACSKPSASPALE